MFSFKNKLDPYLCEALEDKLYKNYRVIIYCKSLYDKIEKKISSLKCEIIRSIPSCNCISAILSPYAIERLVEYPAIKFITFDKYAFICFYSCRFKTHKNSDSIDINISHIKKLLPPHSSAKIEVTGKNICIGTIDTGVYPHANLTTNNNINKFLDIVNNYKYPYDDNGHGTYMAGILCGNNSSSKGNYKGIAVKSTLYSIKAFNKLGKGYVSDILFSLETLINESKEYNIKVIYLPMEILEYNKFILSLFKDMFDQAIKKGITIVVPSGSNSNTYNSMTGIATLPNCITVGGMDTTKSPKPYQYSSCGPCKKLKKPDLCAPCVDIYSLNCDTNYISERNGIKLYPSHIKDPYIYFTGTSAASAYISGVCALIYEKNQDVSFKDVLSLLKLDCEDLDLPKGIQGHGILYLNSILS